MVRCRADPTHGSRQLWKKLVIIWDDNNRAAAATRAICVHFETIRRRSAGFELPRKDPNARLWKFMETFSIECYLLFFFIRIYRNILDRWDTYYSRNILLHLTKLRNIWHVCCNSRMNARDERIALELDGC